MDAPVNTERVFARLCARGSASVAGTGSAAEFWSRLVRETSGEAHGEMREVLEREVGDALTGLELMGMPALRELCRLLERSDEPDFSGTRLASVCCLSGEPSSDNVVVSDGKLSLMLSARFAPFACAYWLLMHTQKREGRDAARSQDGGVVARALLCVVDSIHLTEAAVAAATA